MVVPSKWSMVPSPNASTLGDNVLNGVSCVTSTFCVAAGSASNGSIDQTLVEQWNGKTWSIVPSPDTSTSQNNDFNGVSCAAVSFCVAVGSFSNGSHNQTLVEQWNGTAWSIVPSPDTTSSESDYLNSVSCLTPAFCVATGDAYNGTVDQTLVEQWNGTAWSIVSSPDTSTSQDNYLYAVACTTASFCEATGDAYNGTVAQTLVEQWNGTAWSIVPSPNTSSSESDDLDGVSCVTASFCVAVGFADVATSGKYLNLVEQWNGSAWSIVNVPDANAAFGDDLIAVDCSGPTSCVAAGYVNTIDNSDNTFVTEALTWNGSTWALVSVPEPAATTQEDQVNALSCVPGAMCVGVGYATFGSSITLQTLAVSAPITLPGYWLVASDGGIFTHGGAPFYGSTGNIVLNKPIVGMAATPDGGGYWLVASDGGIFAFGDAGFFGSLGNIVLNKPIVGMAATPDGQGYWLVASDGGIFTHGDAGFFGSQGATALNKPIVGMAATPDGGGYWLVASDGGIFTHGDAGFFGSQGATALNKPIVGMAATPDGLGYWLVASDGGIFTHGDAGFFGSQGATALNKPIVGMAATPDGLGYWLVASDGGIFTHGDAAFAGSEGGTVLNKPIVGMAA
ncbi:MAG TPA: hypothetical protein VND70_05045 [Acidimicrobiales bacterium]|nr:hypothetical protein [Acidimicrobiales bacterium]